MSEFYANLVVHGPDTPDVIVALNGLHHVAYVAPAAGGNTVVFHEDFARQEELASDLSARFECPVLRAMVFGGMVLLYHLSLNGGRVDAYVSPPHEGLELDEPAPEGNSQTL